MSETKHQIVEARLWISDCTWRDELEDLENLTDDEVILGIDRHYEGGWIQFVQTIDLCEL
jgi:hypothetical protein